MYQATRSDKALVVEILVSAFENYLDENQINLVVKQDEKRLQRMQILMEYLFEQAISFGEVYLSDNKKAAFLLKYPQKEKLTWNMLVLNVKLAFGCIGITRVIPVLKRQHLAKKHYPKEPHIQPIIFGVKDEVKGMGVGPRMMFEVREHFKDNTLPAIIDTVAASNVKLYQRFGFKVIDEVDTFGFPIYFLRLDS